MSPHSENPGLLLLKYREYLQKLYSLDTWCLTEQTNATMLHISCARINSSKLQVFQQTRGAQNFSKPFKKHHVYYWVFRLIFHSWFIGYPLDISRAFELTTHMTISSTLKFTNTLPHAWKYHRIDSTKLIQKGVLTGSTQQRSTWVQYFRTKTLQVRSDSTENKLNPIQYKIHYNVHFA